VSNCQEWTAARPIPEGMTIFCLVSFTTGAVRSAMPAIAGFLVLPRDAHAVCVYSALCVLMMYTVAGLCDG